MTYLLRLQHIIHSITHYLSETQFKYPLFILVLLISHSYAMVGENLRPKEIQDKVDHSFKLLNSESRCFYRNEYNNQDRWLYNGKGQYHLMDFDEKKIIRDLAIRDQSKGEIFLVDVGSALGKWATEIEHFILNNLADSRIHFHIFSFTGAEEMSDEGVTTNGNVTQYRYNKFQIENLHSELKKRNIDLAGKVDLLVSRWTLRHLVDPFGTLEDMYDLLIPNKGILLSNGFLFGLKDKDGNSVPSNSWSGVNSISENWQLFAKSSAKYLFRSYNETGDDEQFLLMRTDERSLNLPLEYSGTKSVNEEYFIIKSALVTEYKLTELVDFSTDRLYCRGPGLFVDYYGDLASQEVYHSYKLEKWMRELPTFNYECFRRNKKH